MLYYYPVTYFSIKVELTINIIPNLHLTHFQDSKQGNEHESS